jgi:hypothetical protein
MPGRWQRPRRLAHGRQIGRRRSTQQGGRLRQIRRQYGGQRQQFLAQTLHRRVGQQRGATLGHHHRVDHQHRRAPATQAVGDRSHHVGAAEHAELDGIDADVGEHGVDLRRHERRRQRFDGADAAGVLRRQAAQGRHAVNAQRGKGLQVGLDAGAAGRIGTGDAQDVGDGGGHGR